MELYTFSKYPFLKDAVEYIKANGPTLQEAMDSQIYADARFRGKERVKEALEKGEIAAHDLSSGSKQMIELLSYVVARMLVSAVRDNYLIKRYVLAEAVRAYKRLQQEEHEFVLRVAGELGAEVTATANDDELLVHFTDYVKCSPRLSGSEWKLTNRALKDGYVRLSKRELCRILQELLSRKFLSELPLPMPPAVIKALSSEIRELSELAAYKRKHFAPKTFVRADMAKFPPCIKHIIGMIQESVNVPHMSRFALTTFLNNIGMSNEQIIAIFRASPDFDERMASYQIRHITGNISSTEYTTPRCATMRTYGACPGGDNLCKQEWLKHPLQYYRVKQRGRGGKAKVTGTGPIPF